MNEAELIQRYFTRQIIDSCVTLGIGDDAAVIQPPAGEQLVITTDTMVEGSHFTPNTNPSHIATKLMAVNLSDIAAMGATPKWATLTVTLKTIDENWLAAFSSGLFSCLDRYGVTLVGGDVTKGTETNLAIQLIGLVPQNMALTRKGAEVDDDIYVTGAIGAAAKAVQVLYDNQAIDSCVDEDTILSTEQINALYAPQPRLDVGNAIRSFASAAIDISDGLLHELAIICKQSSLGATLQLTTLPVAENCDMALALAGGDDYELLFTSHKSAREEISSIATRLHCKITRIGHMNNSNKIRLYHGEEEYSLPDKLGFDHFSRNHDE